MKKYKRKDFIELSLLGSAGLYLSACGVHSDNKPPTPPASKDTVVATPAKVEAPPPLPRLVKKGDADYDALRQGFNKRINKYPTAIAVCTSTADVQAAMRYAKDNNLAVAVKSGGHCMEGYSCNDDGLVINLSKLNGIKWIDDQTIRVGPGRTLSAIYEELLPRKKIIPSGSCGGVAIGGLALGGGYGLFSRSLGLTCDSLLDLTMVDGQGNVRSTKDDPELLWACRGGGNGNFGVVTEMTFRVHEAPQLLTAHWFRINTIDIARCTAVMEQWFRLTAALPESCFSAFILNGKLLNIMITNSAAHSQPVQHMIDTLTPLVDKVTIGKPRPLASVVKNYFGQKGPIYFKNASSGLYTGFEEIRPFIGEVIDKVNKTPGMIYQINTMGGRIDTPEAHKKSAFPHRSRHFVSELQTYWEAASQGERLILSFAEVQSIFHKNGVKAQYRNYADSGFQDWEHDYYGDNYARLREVKKHYDPNNLIRSEQSVKLPVV